MTETSRRKLLKTITAGTGAVIAGKTLPENWTKPVVDSVMLPAHAETTGCCEIAGTYCGYFPWGDASEITITVTADGAVTVVLWGEVVGTGSVDCTGGHYTTYFEGGQYAEGMINCGTGSISGIVSWDGQHEYEATIDGCNTPV